MCFIEPPRKFPITESLGLRDGPLRELSTDLSRNPHHPVKRQQDHHHEESAEEKRPQRRARKDSDELRELLERQRTAIRAARTKLRQVELPTIGDKVQQRQVELDLEHLALRETRIADELTEEPRAIEHLYAVQMTRLTPVGLVIAWPEAMT